jgi:sterol desaturase/sphingolipid hydroxylase (fatty acid hydroxylase superfamily)
LDVAEPYSLLETGLMGLTLPGWLTGALAITAFCLLSWLERLRPLRPPIEPVLQHTGRNLTMAALDAIAIRLTETPPAHLLLNLVEQNRWGLTRQMPIPGWAQCLLALLLLDYTLYIWHVLTHRLPLLWRFHLVHHVDLDLDASTALRFHFGEMILSVAFRLAQILLIGASPFIFSVWQTTTLLSILFHHSNVRLPSNFELWINWLVVGPRMHGIHHSASPDLTDSNWSSGLTIWDRLHGTLRLDVPDRQTKIGVPGYRDAQELTLRHLIIMPFEKQREVWLRQPLIDDPALRG